MSENTDKTLVKSPSGRTRRTPVTARSRLSFNGLDTSNFHYRLVNDKDDRVATLQEHGYEVVDFREHKAQRAARVEGGSVDQTIPVGQGDRAVLMRQKLEWYREDQGTKMGMLKATEEGLQPSHENELTGKLKIG